MIDIVERLRWQGHVAGDNGWMELEVVATEAADEIERLREQLAMSELENEKVVALAAENAKLRDALETRAALALKDRE